MAQNQILQALKKGFVLNGEFFSNPEYIETNSSLILFTVNDAFKVIKQEKGKDYSNLQPRYFWLQEELCINSEVSPDLYQAVVPISIQEGQMVIGSDESSHRDEAIEYALRMKKLKQSSRVYNKLVSGTYTERESEIIAREIANFHLSKLRGDLTEEDKNLITEFSSFSALEKVIVDDFEMFEKYKANFVPIVIAEPNYQKIRQYVLGFLRGNKSLLVERINRGYVLPIHGDFHATNMFVEGDSFYAIDRALRRKFRVNDILKDPAYLTVDLEALGFRKEAEHFLLVYQGIIKDACFEDILPFYKCRLAFVRGVVNFRSGLLRQVKTYFDIACKYASG